MTDRQAAHRLERILARTPLVDGHNDWPWALREQYGAGASTLDLLADARRLDAPLHTDIPRLREGRVGAQFWSVWIPPSITGGMAVKETLTQIDHVHTIVRRYPDVFERADSAADIRRIHAAGRIASLIGVEGGNQIDNSLAALRMYHALGARYLTLTHARTTEWADSATDEARHGGLDDFGRAVVRELNRLGMMVDLSHVSDATVRDALNTTRAPAIFSHSCARAINAHPRNVSDELLAMVTRNGGLVMISFVADHVSHAMWRWVDDRAAELARLRDDHLDPASQAVGRELAKWEAANPCPRPSIMHVADHVEHVRRVAGIDHVGLGSDFDGTPYLPEGLDGVEAYPGLFAELLARDWSDGDLAKLAGENLLRVMSACEDVARSMAAEPT